LRRKGSLRNQLWERNGIQGKGEEAEGISPVRLEEREKNGRLIAPRPAPRYDEVFALGQEWLDGQAEGGVSEDTTASRLFLGYE
jgi:hypothetical protein